MKIVVIGGSGHIGTYLVPRLVRAGHEIVSLTRSGRPRYASAPEWEQVTHVTVDREQQDAEGTFGHTVVAQEPDVVIDLVCFTLESATALVTALRGTTDHLIHCGSIWRYGPSIKLPIVEGSASAGAPFDEYGTQKAAIAQMLKDESTAGGLTTTSIHPGHIVGPGWHPTGPLGNIDPAVWHAVSAGGTVRVPGSGAESMHHVHADDVAQAFELAVQNRPRLSRDRLRLVRPVGEARERLLGGVSVDGDRGGLRGTELGPSTPQPRLQHRQGEKPARLRARLRAGAGDPRIRALAHRARAARRGGTAHTLRTPASERQHSPKPMTARVIRRSRPRRRRRGRVGRR
jgi:nucleoside-diphosphate-sugar epimerase